MQETEKYVPSPEEIHHAEQHLANDTTGIREMSRVRESLYNQTSEQAKATLEAMMQDPAKGKIADVYREAVTEVYDSISRFESLGAGLKVRHEKLVGGGEKQVTGYLEVFAKVGERLVTLESHLMAPPEKGKEQEVYDYQKAWVASLKEKINLVQQTLEAANVMRNQISK